MDMNRKCGRPAGRMRVTFCLVCQISFQHSKECKNSTYFKTTIVLTASCQNYCRYEDLWPLMLSDTVLAPSGAFTDSDIPDKKSLASGRPSGRPAPGFSRYERSIWCRFCTLQSAVLQFGIAKKKSLASIRPAGPERTPSENLEKVPFFLVVKKGPFWD